MDKRILIITSGFPPSVSGSMTLMGNLFRHLPPEKLVVLTSRSRKTPKDSSQNIDCLKFYVDLPRWADRYHLQFLLVPFIVYKALIISIKYNVDSIFTQWPSTNFVVAAYFSAILLNKRLFFWYHDLWAERKMRIPDLLMTKFFEKRIINYATQIFTITEAQQTFYKKKYGITTVVLSHSVDFSLVNRRTSHEKTLSNKSYKIIAYSGSIYPQMNLDSLQRLIQAASTIKEYDIRIIFFTSVSKEVLAKWNLLNSKVEVKFVSTPELLSLLDEADILFLPLAFTNCDYLEVQTVFPTKTLEYLLAQTPILVHAPKGSYLADYASAKNFGYVVDRPDVSQLREGILRLLKDDNLRSQLISGAKKAASERDSRCVVNILKYHLLNCT